MKKHQFLRHFFQVAFFLSLFYSVIYIINNINYYKNLFNINMTNPATELNIDTIESYFDQILALTGTSSYVQWENFTKFSTDLINRI